MATYGTTDRCTGGTASGSPHYDIQTPALAFDNNEATFYSTYETTVVPIYLRYDFGASVSWKISRVKTKQYTELTMLDFLIQGSNDATTWITLATCHSANNNTWQTFDFVNKIGYRYIRLYCTASTGGSYIAIYEVEMFEGIYPSGGIGIGNPYIF